MKIITWAIIAAALAGAGWQVLGGGDAVQNAVQGRGAGGAVAVSQVAATREQIPYINYSSLVSTLSRAKGDKVVLLNFWGVNCPPCRKEIPDLVEIRNSYGEDELLVLGICVDDQKDMVVKLAEALRINYPLVIAERDVGVAFNVRYIPKTVIYGVDGRQVFNQEGYCDPGDVRRTIDAALSR